MHDLVNCLLMRAEVVPKHCGILQVRLRIPFLRMDEKRELDRIPQEEHWSVVVYPILVSLICVELDRETSWIASSVWKALLATDG